MDLYIDLQAKTEELDKAVKDLREFGKELAEKERDYKVTLAKACLILKAQNLAVGLIDKVCYGEDDVAEARFERDVAEVMYKACQEEINSLKLKIRLIENQLAREYGR